jgi:hypothetical protein
MSLVVTLRVPDGIVMAADSLSTALQNMGTPSDKIKCPKCNGEISTSEIELPVITVPVSASSYTQKLFSLFDKFGVSSFGIGLINDRSIYYHIKQFEHEHKEFVKDRTPEDVMNLLVKYFSEQFNQWPVFNDPKAPQDWIPLGLHFGGFEIAYGKPLFKTYEMKLGKKNEIKLQQEIGCTFGGEGGVVSALWQISKSNPYWEFKFPLFSLQDAIDHVEFLIGTTIDFQRFTNMTPFVGGEIDIALITPFRGFQWIKRKKLMDILESNCENENNK